MSDRIVHVSDFVTLVGGGECSPDDLATALTLAPIIVAADGGADLVHAAGQVPRAIIGDMDSISPQTRAALVDQLIAVGDQDTTDLDKCLARIVCPAILAIGFLGGRLDHTFAALNSLARQSGALVAMGPQDVLCLVPEHGLRLDLEVGMRLSLLPLCMSKVWSTGLVWDLTGEPMSPTGFLSVSNAVAGPIRIRAQGTVFLVLPKRALPILWAAVADN